MGRNLRIFSSMFVFSALFISVQALAAPKSTSKAMGQSVEELKYRYEMNLDVSAVYVRDTKPVGGSDTGVKLNLGGMFSSWVGLDAIGMLELKSKSYLVGSSLRLVPIDWLYFRLGAGGYSDRTTKEIKATPIVGAGLVGRFSEYYYMTAEGLAFNGTDGGRNIGFAAGLGMIF